MAGNVRGGGESARLVHGFIEDEGAKLHRALGVDAHFDNQRAEYVRGDPFYELQEMIQLYQTAARPPLDFELSSCTWETVLDQMNKAELEYQGRAENVVRRAVRKLGDVAVILSPVLEMIPDDHGLSVLHGGLAIMFSAARYRSECRQTIFRAFGNVPKILEKAHRQRAAFPADTSLKICLEELYASLVSGIAKMIATLLPTGVLGKLKKPFYQNSVDAALEAIRRNVESVNGCVEVLVQRNITQTRHIVQSNERQLHEIRYTTKLSEIQIRDISRQVEEVKEHVQGISERSLEGMNALFRFLVDCLEEKQRQVDSQHLLVSTAARRPGGDVMISVPEILSVLAVPHMQAAQDLEYVVRRGSDFGSASLGQARYLVQTTQFHRWLYSPHSELLAVEANLDLHHTDKISPVSVIGATLVLAIGKLQPVISIHFFCGQHLADRDGMRGPPALLRSLISQLLLQPSTWDQLNLGFISDPRYLDDLQAYNPEALCDVFVQLLRQLSRVMTVLCVVDGISWYEDQDDWGEGVPLILSGLNSAIISTGSAPQPSSRLKVLLTCTGRSQSLRNWVQEDQLVSLSGDNIDDGIVSDRAFF